MKIKANDIHVFWYERLLKQVQAAEYSFLKATINFIRLAVIPEFGEPFVSKGSYGHLLEKYANERRPSTICLHF